MGYLDESNHLNIPYRHIVILWYETVNKGTFTVTFSLTNGLYYFYNIKRRKIHMRIGVFPPIQDQEFLPYQRKKKIHDLILKSFIVPTYLSYTPPPPHNYINFSRPFLPSQTLIPNRRSFK